MEIKRGEVYSTNLIDKDSQGAEISKIRPALVVQDDIWNKLLPSTIIVPLTSQMPGYISAGTVTLQQGAAGLEKDSNILFSQIRSVDKSRLVKKLGEVPADKMRAANKALSLTLGLEPAD